MYKDNVGEVNPDKMTINGLNLQEAERLFSRCEYVKKDVILDKDKVKDIHGE